MFDAAQHAYPAGATTEKHWMDPQRRRPQRLTETLGEQRIFLLGQVGKKDTIIFLEVGG